MMMMMMVVMGVCVTEKKCADGDGSDNDEGPSGDDDDDGGGGLCNGKKCSDGDGVQLAIGGGNGGGPGTPIPENTAVGVVVGNMPIPRTPAGLAVVATYTVQSSSSGKARSRRAVDTGDGAIFATPDPDKLAFAVDENSGQITVSSALDFETKPNYEFAVVINAGGDDQGKFLPYTAVIPVDIAISPVYCPDGQWSPTGTYPCADHKPACEFNETSTPTSTNDRMCSKLSEAIGDDETGNAGVTAAISVLLVIAACGLVVFALLYKRRAQAEKDGVDSIEAGKSADRMLNPMFLSAGGLGDYMTPMLAGPPGVPRSRAVLAYHRVAAYDAIYHGNDLLVLPDPSVVRIYRHFQLHSPSDQELLGNRRTTNAFMDLPVAQNGIVSEANLHDAVEFVARAMADVLADRAIDCLVDFAVEAKETSDDAFVAACDSALLKDYVPMKNQFLEAVEGFAFEDLRQLIAGENTGPVYMDASPDALGEATYEMANGNTTMHEYMTADGKTESAYEMAAGNAGGQGQATYEIAGRAATGATYEMAGNFDHQNTYEMADAVGAGDGITYEMAGAYTQQMPAGSAQYDTGAARPESALYAMASGMEGQGSTSAGSRAEATYAMASGAGGEATYEMAASDQVTRNASQRPKSMALYALGEAEGPTESNDGDYGSAAKITLMGADARDSSDGAGTGPRRGLPMQVYALGGAAENEAESTDDISPAKRSNSYGDALDTVGIVSPTASRMSTGNADGRASMTLEEPSSPLRSDFQFTTGKVTDSRPPSDASGAPSFNIGVVEDDVDVDAEGDDEYIDDLGQQFSESGAIKSVRRLNPMFRNSAALGGGSGDDQGEYLESNDSVAGGDVLGEYLEN